MAQVKSNKDPGLWSCIFILLFGLALIVIPYGNYQDDAWLDKISTRSPMVCMKITHRTRGAGTVKFPCKIYADYQGSSYQFDMGSKSFRKMLGVDTIEACLDPASGRAFLPISGRVRHYIGLYILMGGGGVILVGKSIRELGKLGKTKNTGG